MSGVLVIDIDRCRECGSCKVPCSYTLHPENNGILRLREIAEFALSCRRCVRPPCVRACPASALQRTPSDGLITRRPDRCVSCGSCAFSCPFGAIPTEVLISPESVCDLCAGRLAEGESPVCVGACGRGAVSFVPREKASGVELRAGSVPFFAVGKSWKKQPGSAI
ncbi:MAG: 4Fe-4S dicluster domain-containing protein [bacterium]|nr:4Fe-4S dicluster domain-containing protein [bacterium]